MSDRTVAAVFVSLTAAMLAAAGLPAHAAALLAGALIAAVILWTLS